MARIHTLSLPLLIVVCCVVANAKTTTPLPPPPNTLKPEQHNAIGENELHPSWQKERQGATQGMPLITKLSTWKGQVTPTSQERSHTRVLSRLRRQAGGSNWFTRMFHQKRRAITKFFYSPLWGRYRHDIAFSSIFMFISTALNSYFHSLGLGELGSLSTYMELLWIAHELLKELEMLADEECFYPTYWPLNMLSPDHCNPYRELQQLLDRADELEVEDKEGDEGEKSEEQRSEGSGH